MARAIVSVLHVRTRRATAKPSRACARYSLAKFQQLDAYCARVTPWRIALVLIAAPLPGLLASVLPCMLRLQDVRNGPNLAIVVHTGCIVSCSTFGLFLTWVEVTHVPRAAYSLAQLATVSALATVLYCTLFAAVTFHAVFPLPFGSILGTPLLLLFIAVAHGVVFGARLWRDPIYWQSLRDYGPSVAFQMSQVVLYPVVSILFDHVSLGGQIALTLAFPLLKWILKKLLKRLALALQDCSAEVAVCGIEITGSLYQSMILQTSPTPLAMGLIIGLDLLQGLFHIGVFMDKYAQVFTHATNASASTGRLSHRYELIPLARQLLDDANVTSDDAIPDPKRKGISLPMRGVAVSPATCSTRDAAQRYTLSIALETLYVGEEMLLAEYFEVVIPLLNSAFLAIATQFPSAQYNPRLAPFSVEQTSLRPALQSMALYSLLQGATLVVFHAVLRWRYGLSAFSCLAFILERHALSITGKLLAWLPFILHFSIAQYGVDFSFRFDWMRPDTTSH